MLTKDPETDHGTSAVTDDLLMHMLPDDLSNWMYNLPQRILKKPFNGIAIPGSHDSCTSKLQKNAGSLTDRGFIPRGVIYNRHKTQNLNFTEQLQAGIRYLDLRVAYKRRVLDHFRGAYYFVHDLYPWNVSQGMKEVADFLDKHPKEVVILDFNHFHKMRSNRRHYAVARDVLNIFGSKVCPVVDIKTLTLAHLQTHGYQVLIFYHAYRYDKKKLWPKTGIRSNWAKTTNVIDLITYLDEGYRVPRSPSIFHVNQGVLTPTYDTVTRNPQGTLEATMGLPATKAVVLWLRGKTANQTHINIVSVDFVESHDFIRAVIALNYK